MKGTFALLGLLGTALASPLPQAASGSAPSGCSSSTSGSFSITVTNVTQSATKRSYRKRQLDGTLMLTLEDGVLKDQAGRTGYIAANDQFQFDEPIQAGALVTSGWSLCGNGSLALGSSAVFYQCLSGTFYNLYDKSQGGQCAAVYFESLGGSTTSSAAALVVSDGQPQATTGVPASVISDGQPQATTGAPAVSVISDGQPQATTGAAVSQISDGQPQATTGAAVSQISDGQPQATTGAAVSQISDGQVQATTATGAAVSQISDGQVQATTATPVSQITDGQVQAPTGTSAAIATFTGAADRNMAGSFALAAGIFGAIALL